jgi:hypothetical protein
MKRFLILVSICHLFSFNLIAQNLFPSNGVVYNDNLIPKIYIAIDQDSLDLMLATENLYSDYEYPADFIWNDGIETDTLLNIGFRLRGNTSRVSDKKSFKIKFDHFGGKKFHGISDLNLNGEHNDPSVSRSKLCFDMLKKARVPSSRTNHVELYINEEYMGLYLNVEHIDKDYLEERYEDKSGNLYKCFYGCDFKYKGQNKNNYKYNNDGSPIYELKTNEEEDDYSDLINFTEALQYPYSNNYKCNIEKLFDVESYIRAAALEVIVGHWDGPIFNKNNAYLYHNPTTDKLEYIPYDMDNTLGIDWFNVDWSKRDIYNWEPSGSSRPIYENLMKVPEYRSRFTYYVDLYIDSFFNESYLFPYLNDLKTKLSPSREDDYYAQQDYGYDYEDFLNSFDIGLGAHANIGLKQYINNRFYSAKSQLEEIDFSPIIENISFSWDAEKVVINGLVTSMGTPTVTINYSYDNQNWFSQVLNDTGENGDLIMDDAIYSTNISYQGTTDFYYYFDLDDSNNNTRHPRCENYITFIGFNETPSLSINEFMASNMLIKDEANEFEDWIEIYNGGQDDVYLGDRYLTDTPSNITKWQMPDVTLKSGEFYIIWADEDQEQGENHANFKLDKDGEFIGLYDNEDNNFAPIDTFSFSLATPNKSYGKYPDGQAPNIELNTITHGYSNVITVTNDEEKYNLKIYSNPSRYSFRLSADEEIKSIIIYNLNGARVYSEDLNSKNPKIHIPPLPYGLYLLNVVFENKNIMRRIIFD